MSERCIVELTEFESFRAKPRIELTTQTDFDQITRVGLPSDPELEILGWSSH
jgi:hypothetical protein